VETADDIAKAIDGFGFCIECSARITLDLSKPLCPPCYSRLGRNGEHSRCHRCGQPHSTRLNQPLCSPCAAVGLTDT
jgi:hypothetical protein